MNPDNVTVGIAFVAGLLSFISPCVLPLVPAYIGYMGGRVTNTVSAQVAVSKELKQTAPGIGSRFSTFLHGISFVSGFTLVFVIIGLLTTAFIRQISGQSVGIVTDMIGRLGGILIVFFGIHFMGILPLTFRWIRQQKGHYGVISALFALFGSLLILWGISGTITIWVMIAQVGDTSWVAFLALVWFIVFLLWLFLGGAFTRPEKFWYSFLSTIERWLYTDTRRLMTASGKQSYIGSVLMGVIFSAGWTPCIGPVYGAVLTMAANGGDLGRAFVLLVGYSLGLGVPFLLTALLLDGAQSLLRSLQHYMRPIELVSGVFLIIVGIAVASGELQRLSSTFATGEFAEASSSLESTVIDRITGESPENSATPPVTSDSTGLTFIETGTLGDTETPVNNPNQGLLSPVESIEDMAGSLNGAEIGLGTGNIAPDFEAVTDHGETISLSSNRGKVVVLNFWATWCSPCRLEMPEFQLTYEERANEGFTVIAVNNRESVDDVTGFREEYGLTFPLVLDTQGEIQDLYRVMMYPSSYIIDREGTIIARHFGVMNAAQLQELVDRAMG